MNLNEFSGSDKIYSTPYEALVFRKMAAFVFLVSILCGFTFPNEAKAESTHEKRPVVFVSIPPIKYLVDRIGSPYFDVFELLPPGRDPHTFDPTPQTIAKLSQAKLFFKTGFPFEETLLQKVKSINPDLLVVDTRQGVELLEMEDWGDHHEDHDNWDPHTWLDPLNAKIQARLIQQSLKQLDPEHAPKFESALKEMEIDLDSLDEQLRISLKPFEGKPFFVYHPAYGYFAHRYGLKQMPVQMSGKEPSAKQLRSIVDSAKSDGVKVIFVQPQFFSKSAQTLANSVGAVIVPMNDLAYDYINNLRDVSQEIQRALKNQVE